MGLAKVAAAAVCVVAIAGGVAACGGSDDTAVPEGVPEVDIEIGREVAAGFRDVKAVADGDLSADVILERYSEIGKQRRPFADSHKGRGVTPCIRNANQEWWALVHGFAAGDMTSTPSGRANVMLAAADLAPAVQAALNSCPADLQEAIAWPE